MTTYRVGEAGATVFNADGKPLATLRPGFVVIEGKITQPGSLADQHNRQAARKRLGGYQDKAIRPSEDKG